MGFLKEHGTFTTLYATYFGFDLAEQVHRVVVLFIGRSADTAAQEAKMAECIPSDPCWPLSYSPNEEVVLLMELT